MVRFARIAAAAVVALALAGCMSVDADVRNTVAGDAGVHVAPHFPHPLAPRRTHTGTEGCDSCEDGTCLAPIDAK